MRALKLSTFLVATLVTAAGCSSGFVAVSQDGASSLASLGTENDPSSTGGTNPSDRLPPGPPPTPTPVPTMTKWTGAVSDSWITPGNWLNGVLPTKDLDCEISATPLVPVLSGNSECKNLVLKNGGRIDLDTAPSGLSVFGDLTIEVGFVFDRGASSAIAMKGSGLRKLQSGSRIPGNFSTATPTTEYASKLGSWTPRIYNGGEVRTSGNVTLDGASFADDQLPQAFLDAEVTNFVQVSGDTTIKGVLTVSGAIEIPSGVTLTVESGEVRFGGTAAKPAYIFIGAGGRLRLPTSVTRLGKEGFGIVINLGTIQHGTD